MAVGSAFDAFVKSALSDHIFGINAKPQYEFEALFESQVDEGMRDVAYGDGARCFQAYVFCGAFDDLVRLMDGAIEEPQFEMKVEETVEGIPMIGYADLRFVHKSGLHFIHDWKIKGYCSIHGASPAPGYALCRDGFSADKQTRSHMTAHKRYTPMHMNGLEINTEWMENCYKPWATQLSMYGWMLGEPVGAENVVITVDEIVSKYLGDSPPQLRIAQHRSRASKQFQNDWLAAIKFCWEAISSGHIFTDMTKEENDLHCEHLNQVALALCRADDDWFNQLCRERVY
jgi:hypothetical protein